MTSRPISRRSKLLAYGVHAILTIVGGWTLWGVYEATQWASWFIREHSLAHWVSTVAFVICVVSWGFVLWFFKWLIGVVYEHMLNR